MPEVFLMPRRRMPRRRAGVACLLLLALAGLSCSPAEEQPGSNIVLIVVDALRPDHLGCYGYGHPTSPVIDSLASTGVLFENAIAAAPWTKTSFSSFLTSLYPFQHGVVDWESIMPDSIVTLPQVLAANGYSTMAVVNMLGITGRFEVLKGIEQVSSAAKSKRDAVTTTADAIELMKTAREPFFILVHYFDVHWPYRPPIKHLDRVRRGDDGKDLAGGSGLRRASAERPPQERIDHEILLYDGCIRFADAGIGRLLEYLRQAGLSDRTLVIVTADHGEAFWEHGVGSHGHSTHEEEIRVPLIFSFPGRYSGPRRLDAQVSLIDLVPTITGLTGVPDSHHREGRDLDDLIVGGRYERSRPGGLLPVEFDLCESTLRKSHGSRCLRSTDWKLMIEPATSLVSLYDLKGDPGERENLRGSAGNPGDSLLALIRRVPGSSTGGWRLGFTGGRTDVAYEVEVRLGDGGRLTKLEMLLAGSDPSVDVSEDSTAFHLKVIPSKQEIVIFDADPRETGIQLRIAGEEGSLPPIYSGLRGRFPATGMLDLTPDLAAGLPEDFDANRTGGEPGIYVWWLPGEGTGARARSTKLTPDETARLRALGYIQ